MYLKIRKWFYKKVKQIFKKYVIIRNEVNNIEPLYHKYYGLGVNLRIFNNFRWLNFLMIIVVSDYWHHVKIERRKLLINYFFI